MEILDLLPETVRPLRFAHLYRTTDTDPELGSYGESMTEPDQVRPLEVLLRHRAQGAPVPYFNGKYEEEDFSDIDEMDRVELAAFRERLRDDIEFAEEQFHVATRRLAEQREEINTLQTPGADPGSPKASKASKKASKEESHDDE